VLTGFFGTLALYDEVTPAMGDEADRLLVQVGLSHVSSQPYANMSSGERVRSLIARALATRPALMLLDEPTAGLDLLAREQVLATVQALFENGNDAAARPTVILITHHVEELPPATSRVLLLSNGQVAGEGSPAQVLRGDLLSSVYGCPVDVRVEGGTRYYTSVHPDAWRALLRSESRRDT
jgi:iron complex transport system ATP-binding protein